MVWEKQILWKEEGGKNMIYGEREREKKRERERERKKETTTALCRK